jgi:hypothetical protein
MSMTVHGDDEFAPYDPLEEAVRLAAEVFVFAPLGLLLSAREVIPTLVERGRRQVKSANTIGKFVVPIAKRKAEQKVHATVDRFRSGVETLFDRDPSVDHTENHTENHANHSENHAKQADHDEAPQQNDGSRVHASSRIDDVSVPDMVASTSDRADASKLGIADYDTLPSTTILDLLAALNAEELTEIAQYERAHRGRRTVLHSIEMRLAAS